MILADVGFDDADAAKVFLDDGIELVVNLEDLAEQRVGEFDNQPEAYRHDRNRDQKVDRQLGVDHQAHNECENEHQRRPEGDADQQHVSHLNVGDVGGHSGDQTPSGEVVDVFK